MGRDPVERATPRRGEARLAVSPGRGEGGASTWQESEGPQSDGSRRLVDLRSELSETSDALTRLTNPLPARLVHLRPGSVDLDLIDLDADGYGLMLLDGLLLAELDAGRSRAGWLIGAQDLIRPSGLYESVLTEQTRWRALAPTRVVMLDRAFGLRAGGIPMVARTLVTRATRTSNWLLAKSLILSSPVVEERLLLLFALLGERWGRVTTEGVALTLPLTHEMLGTLCGARRPSVTLALHALERGGLLTCGGKGSWLFRRPLTDTGLRRTSCFSQYERSLGLSWFAPP
jgi:Crp-like helix-turn-helix domain